MKHFAIVFVDMIRIDYLDHKRQTMSIDPFEIQISLFFKLLFDFVRIKSNGCIFFAKANNKRSQEIERRINL